MRIRLDPQGLIITPDNYVEQIALQAWSQKQDNTTGILIEAFKDSSLERCEECGTHLRSLQRLMNLQGEYGIEWIDDKTIRLTQRNDNGHPADQE